MNWRPEPYHFMMEMKAGAKVLIVGLLAVVFTATVAVAQTDDKEKEKETDLYGDETPYDEYELEDLSEVPDPSLLPGEKVGRDRPRLPGWDRPFLPGWDDPVDEKPERDEN